MRYELERLGVTPVPGRTSVYGALVRHGRIDPAKRRRRRNDYKRWEGRPMELWQMDVVGGVHLGDGTEMKVVTGIDDSSRFVVSAKVIARDCGSGVRLAEAGVGSPRGARADLD